ncbi:similar to ILITYHIA [Actinidia rufa]|uniref:Similar to ILITYHIA n=1 Tax=Actinidia rufa TaxID=165716 RepID=A0A7J0FWE5_9ERIC|nr:similar to ILITYHIA [Actinidia rufa]
MDSSNFVKYPCRTLDLGHGEFNAHALGVLAEVAGPGLDFHLSTVVPALLTAMGDDNMEVQNLAKKAAETVVLVIDEEGIEPLISELLNGVGEHQTKFIISDWILLQKHHLYLVDEAPNMISILIILLSDSDSTTVAVAWEALSRVFTSVPKEVLPSYIKLGHEAVSTSRDKERWKRKGRPILISGLCLPKALQPLLPIFLQLSFEMIDEKSTLEIYIPQFYLCPSRPQSVSFHLISNEIPTCSLLLYPNKIPNFMLLFKICICSSFRKQFLFHVYFIGLIGGGLISGSAELREQAAQGLGELVEVTSEQALKEFVIPITGRVQFCNFEHHDMEGWDGPETFPSATSNNVYCLQDNTRIVRSRAAVALGKLGALSTRVDPLVGDLVSSLQASDGGVREAILTALKGVLKYAGKSVSSTFRTRVYTVLKDLIYAMMTKFEPMLQAYWASFCSFSYLTYNSQFMTWQYMDDGQLSELFGELLSSASSPSWSARRGLVLTLSSTLEHNPSMVCASPKFSIVVTFLKDFLKEEKFPVRETSTKAFGRLLLRQIQNEPLNSPGHVETLVSLVSAMRRRALSAVKAIAKANPSVLVNHVTIFGPALAECLKDGNTPVRLAAERCALHSFQLARVFQVQTASKLHRNSYQAWMEDDYPSFLSTVMIVKTVKMTCRVADNLLCSIIGTSLVSSASMESFFSSK